MNFLTATHTDVGIKKKTNQDSMLVQQAATDFGNVLLAVICDGMGGLSNGELASAAVIRDFSAWFKGELPELLYAGLRQEALEESWRDLIDASNRRISDYSERLNVKMGTTCVALLVVGNTYYIINIGDSRVYLATNDLYQLTKDQTFIQQEMDANRMTYEQAMNDPRRNVLLQCIGASDYLEPDFFMGTVQPNQSFLLCSDGFRHIIEPREIFERVGPAACISAAVMKKNLVYLTELNKQRRETDNISAIAIKTY